MTIEVTQQELELQREYIKKVKEINLKRDEIPLAHVHSFGCQQNVSDGEKIKGMLALMGYGFTSETENADLILFNTCAVRENAEDRVFGNIGALKKLKAAKKDLIIAVGGCMVQQEHIAARMRKSFPQVDIIFGTHVMHELPRMIYEKLSENRRTLSIPDSDGVIAEGLPLLRESKVKASVPIMYGCNNFCTYCIVPYVRGRERSRRPEEIIGEVRSLIADGYKEILLLGQNVNSYGKEYDVSFSELLRRLDAIDGEYKISFMTSHPKDISPELIDVMAAHDNICKQLHLPVQSGSSRILKEMNRRYTREHYLGLIVAVRRVMPDIALSTDVMVGFPGETQEDFADTLSLMEQVRYDSAYTFVYSPRIGTKAAAMEGQIPEEEKQRRIVELVALQNEITYEKNLACVGRRYSVLVEGESLRDDGCVCGRTDCGRMVNLAGTGELVGRFVDVEITEGKKTTLFGKLV